MYTFLHIFGLTFTENHGPPFTSLPFVPHWVLQNLTKLQNTNEEVISAKSQGGQPPPDSTVSPGMRVTAQHCPDPRPISHWLNPTPPTWPVYSTFCSWPQVKHFQQPMGNFLKDKQQIRLVGCRKLRKSRRSVVRRSGYGQCLLQSFRAKQNCPSFRIPVLVSLPYREKKADQRFISLSYESWTIFGYYVLLFGKCGGDKHVQTKILIHRVMFATDYMFPRKEPWCL